MRLVMPLIALLAIPSPALAYIDPGTGSYMVQVIAASFFGALYVIKLYWYKITGLFTGRKPDPKDGTGKPEPPKDPPTAA